MVIGKGHAVPLGRFSPLQVMLGWLIILAAISSCMRPIFPLFLLVIKP